MAITHEIQKLLASATARDGGWISLTELAERTKITLSNLSNYRSGNKLPNAETCERIASALGHKIIVKKS